MLHKEKILQVLTPIADKVIKHYKTDFTTHDMKMFNSDFVGHFIWAARESGTHLFFVPMNDEDLRNVYANEIEPYLFGQKRPQDIYKDTATCFDNVESLRESKDMYFYNGTTIKKIEPSKAKAIWLESVRLQMKLANKLAMAAL